MPEAHAIVEAWCRPGPRPLVYKLPGCREEELELHGQRHWSLGELSSNIYQPNYQKRPYSKSLLARSQKTVSRRPRSEPLLLPSTNCQAHRYPPTARLPIHQELRNLQRI